LIIDFIKFISDENDLNYTNEQIEYFKKNFVLSSLHKQPNNEHLNIIVPNVFLDLNDNKKLKRIDLGKKRYSSFLKTLTNKLLLEYGHNYLEYQIKSQRNNRNRKNKLHYATQQLQEQLEKQELHLNEKVEKIQTRIGHYFNRMETAITDKDKTKFDKNLEYVQNNLDKLQKIIGSNDEDDTLSKQIADIKSILGENDFSFDNYPSPKI
jgi:type III secretory pathway component EscV